jgi:hypothetical protein
MSVDQGQPPVRSGKREAADVTGTLGGILLCIAGVANFLQGLTAISRNDLYVVANNYILKFDTTTWGWIHLILGVVAVAIGVAILVGAAFGQLLGVLVASVLVLTNFASLPYYPIWSVVIIGFNVLVIWALITQLRSAEG